jgi:hypothetical protein
MFTFVAVNEQSRTVIVVISIRQIDLTKICDGMTHSLNFYISDLSLVATAHCDMRFARPRGKRAKEQRNLRRIFN